MLNYDKILVMYYTSAPGRSAFKLILHAMMKGYITVDRIELHVTDHLHQSMGEIVLIDDIKEVANFVDYSGDLHLIEGKVFISHLIKIDVESLTQNYIYNQKASYIIPGNNTLGNSLIKSEATALFPFPGSMDIWNKYNLNVAANVVDPMYAMDIDYIDDIGEALGYKRSVPLLAKPCVDSGSKNHFRISNTSYIFQPLYDNFKEYEIDFHRTRRGIHMLTREVDIVSGGYDTYFKYIPNRYDKVLDKATDFLLNLLDYAEYEGIGSATFIRSAGKMKIVDFNPRVIGCQWTHIFFNCNYLFPDIEEYNNKGVDVTTYIVKDSHTYKLV